MEQKPLSSLKLFISSVLSVTKTLTDATGSVLLPQTLSFCHMAAIPSDGLHRERLSPKSLLPSSCLAQPCGPCLATTLWGSSCASEENFRLLPLSPQKKMVLHSSLLCVLTTILLPAWNTLFFPTASLVRPQSAFNIGGKTLGDTSQ